MFDRHGIYNSENDHIWAINRRKANRRGGRKQQGKFAEKVMVWLTICLENVVFLVLFKKGALDHHRYIEEALLVVLRYGNSKFGSN